jgi:hypothetical protein
MICRVALQFPYDSALPRDEVSIHPHFSTPDPDALVAALKANLIAWTVIGAHPFEIKAYDAQKAPPSYPVAQGAQTGTAAASTQPRENALCLSYFSTWNRPRYRGRLYLPGTWVSASPGVRPTGTAMTAAMGFATAVLTKNLPAESNWVVYSRTDNKAYGVTDYWVDDEWDTVRSRGLRSTTRQTAKV